MKKIIYENIWEKLNQKIKNHEYILKLIISILGIFATIIAAFLGAYFGNLGSENLWHKQIDTQNKNLAHALYLETIILEPQINNVSQSFNEKLQSPETGLLLNDPIYPDDGLYYSFQKEIIVFNPELSTNLYSFYGALTEAEKDRKLIMENREWLLSHQSTSTDIEWERTQRTSDIKILSKYMAKQLNFTVEVLPKIKEQLKNEFSE